jgi:hypothetical protein
MESIAISVDITNSYYKHTACFPINILPLVEGVMVDYHTRENISHSGKRISGKQAVCL